MEQYRIYDRKAVQEKVNKFFDTYREEKINGVNFQLMPAVGDIPEIKKVCYSPDDDTFEILFAKPEKVIKNVQGDVVFLEDSQKRLVGIQIMNIKTEGIEKIKLDITSTLDQKIANAKIALDKNPTPQGVAQIDIEGRKIDFLKTFVEEDMSNLVTCS
jgi:hypothetical protein